MNNKDTRRILVVGDIHGWHSGPPSRSDDYSKAILEETKETVEIAIREECDAWIQVGDMFHHPEPAPWFRNKMIEALKNDHMREIGLIGNHDVDHNLEKIKVSALGTLFNSGVLEHGHIFPDLSMACHDYRDTLIDEIVEDEILLQNEMAVQVIHGSLVPDKYFGQYVTFDDVTVNPKTKIVISGHIHYPMDYERPDGVLFVNPGSITRNKLNSEHTRQPHVLLLEYTMDGFVLEKKLIELQSSKPISDIFKIGDARDKKAKLVSSQHFVKKITNYNDTGVIRPVNILDSVRESAKLKNVEEEILDTAIAALVEISRTTGNMLDA